jgi:hypothetical protein
VKLIFLHGLPGFGKLTDARELAKLTRFKIFHNHLAVDLNAIAHPGLRKSLVCIWMSSAAAYVTRCE